MCGFFIQEKLSHRERERHAQVIKKDTGLGGCGQVGLRVRNLAAWTQADHQAQSLLYSKPAVHQGYFEWFCETLIFQHHEYPLHVIESQVLEIIPFLPWSENQ